MGYVSYEFYSQTFGTMIPEADFSKAETKAEAAISYLTYVNGDIFAVENDNVKLAVRGCGGDLQQRTTDQCCRWLCCR